MTDEQNNDPIDEQPDAGASNPPTSQTEEVEPDYKDKWLRAQADYQNLQKEVAKMRSDWVKMSEIQVLEDFIPVYDNFKKATAHRPDEGGNWKPWADGVGFIQKQFGDILKQYNVEEIPTVDEVFNTEVHDAVGEEESDKPPGTVIREVDGGYRANGRVLKPAKVIISK